MNKEQKLFWRKLKAPWYNQVEITTNAELREAIRHSKLIKQTTGNLAKYLVHLAEKELTRKNFQSFTYAEDLIQDAITNMLRYYHRYDETKSSNAYSYLTVLCRSSFARTIHNMNRQNQIKKNMAERVEFGQHE